MGFFAIGSSLKTKSLVIALLFSIAIGSMFAGSALADNNATLEKLEKWLFFATFPTENDEDRIKRLEERTFGEATEGTVDDRLKKLDEVLSQRQKEKEDQEKPAANPAPSSGASSSPENNFGSSPGVSDSTSSSSQRPVSSTRANSGANDAEAVKERQRIAVQAAREQEMHDLLQEGAKLWRARQGPEAVERFEQVLRLDPQNPDAHFSIGVIKEAQGKLKEARDHYVLAAQKNPDNHDYDDAIAAVNRKLQAAPQDPNRALLEKANAAFKRGEYISAVNLYKEAEEKNPKQASVKYSLGATYLMMKDHFNALEYFKLAQQLEPNNEKYTKSYNDLSAEIAKHQGAQQGIQNEYQGDGSIQTPAPTTTMSQLIKPGASKPKDKKTGKPPVAVAGSPVSLGAVPAAQAPYAQGQQQNYGNYPQQQYAQAPMQQPMRQAMPQQMPQQMPAQYPNRQMPPPQQYPSSGYPGQYGAPQQNPYAAVSPGYPVSSNQGTYIPPDPQQYSYQGGRQQMPQQMPQQQMPQQQMPQQQVQQRMPQQMPQQSYQGGSGQYGGGQAYGAGQNQYAGMNGQDYTPPPQSAPQGAFDPQLAQQLNNPSSVTAAAKVDAMTSFGLSGKASNEGVLLTSIRGGSRAAKAGLQKGDVIRTVDGNEVMQPSQLNQAFAQTDSSQTLPILIFRNGTLMPIQF